MVVAIEETGVTVSQCSLRRSSSLSNKEDGMSIPAVLVAREDTMMI